MSAAWARGIVFTALVLLAPWPWYLVAVGGLLPVPVTLMMTIGVRPGGITVALLVVCAVLGLAAFWLAARLLGRYSRNARPWAVAGAVGALALVAQLPVYSGSLARGTWHDAYTAYATNLAYVRCHFTTPRDTRRC